MQSIMWDDYYKKQMVNLLTPNEKYINSEKNKNKADLIRMKYVYDDLRNVCSNKKAMLDIGCNDGYFMRYFDWTFQDYLGVDMFAIDEYCTDYCEREDYYTKGGKIEYKCGLFEEYDFGKNKFDFIFAGEIIEHVLSVDIFLQKIIKVMKEDSILAITTPNNIGGDYPAHNRQFDKGSLFQLLNNLFINVIVKELPAINESWPFLYARCDGLK